LDISLLSDLA
jgi:hypothetical protein